MDPQLKAAIIGGVFLVLATLAGGLLQVRTTRRTASHVETIATQTKQLQPNGGSSIYDLVNRVAASTLSLQETVRTIADEQQHVRTDIQTIKTEQRTVRADLNTQQETVRDELAAHRETTTEDKLRAHKEATRMWEAIAEVAKAHPPTAEGD